MPPLDRRNRPLRDLRISVTDRCNFRCGYCMPREVFGSDFPFLSRDELLTFEEIQRLTRIFTELGVRKVRITGGEPLLRKNVEDLVRMLSRIDGIDDLTMTTNASLLAAKATTLREAGLQRVTVSLDALDDEVFQAMSDTRLHVDTVLEGMDAAASAGLTPLKVNTVVRRGWNERQIVKLARHFRGSGHILRFIEFMDVGNSNGWCMDEVVSARAIYEEIHALWPLEPVEPNEPGEVANRYRYVDGAGEIGLIASVTQPFCATCNRARLTSNGELFTCLFSNRGHDLRKLLRSGMDDTELTSWIHRIWTLRDDRYSEVRTEATAQRPRVEMSRIGG